MELHAVPGYCETTQGDEGYTFVDDGSMAEVRVQVPMEVDLAKLDYAELEYEAPGEPPIERIAEHVDRALTFALLALEHQRLDRAVAAAREGARLAQGSEQVELVRLAGLVLARTRRFQERPHHAVRILDASKDDASVRWAEWEPSLGGGRPSGPWLEP